MHLLSTLMQNRLSNDLFLMVYHAVAVFLASVVLRSTSWASQYGVLDAVEIALSPSVDHAGGDGG